MLPLLMPRCCHRRAAAALLNALPLPPKLRFRQAAASAAKLATAAAVLPPPRCHRHATTAYKIKEKCIMLLTYLFFHHDGNRSKQ
jgi:hypothetical protein